jgi:peptidylprolyl isomerase
MRRGAIPTTHLLLITFLVLLVAGCGRSREEATPTPLPPTQAELAANTPAAPNQEQSMTTASGLQYTERLAGSGPKPQPGEIVTVHYTGKLEDGTVFDSSHNSGEPINFPLGMGYVIPGWDEGIALMSQGGQATLVIPPALAYGEEGFGNVIPPNATLTFDVELVAIAPGSPTAPTAVDASSYITTEQGIKYVDLVAGDGPAATNGQLIVTHYTGWLEDGTKFDSSIDRGEPYSFNLGMGQVIAGWDLGLRGMKVGATRQLVIPAQYAYGEEGYGGVIPPNATLIFEIELLEAQ